MAGMVGGGRRVLAVIALLAGLAAGVNYYIFAVSRAVGQPVWDAVDPVIIVVMAALTFWNLAESVRARVSVRGGGEQRTGQLARGCGYGAVGGYYDVLLAQLSAEGGLWGGRRQSVDLAISSCRRWWFCWWWRGLRRVRRGRRCSVAFRVDWPVKRCSGEGRFRLAPE